MPNWCDCELYISGASGVLSCLAELDEGATGEPVLDFNQIVPMPEILNDTVSGSTTDMGLIALGEADVEAQECLSWPRFKNAGITDIEGLKRHIRDHYPEAIEDAKRSLAAKKQTGCHSWYDWSCANWGTKWNAHNAKVVEQSDECAMINFFTAWSPPLPVVKALSEKYPELSFTLKYFEGGMGFNGIYVCENGEVLAEESGDYFGDRGG